MRYKIIKVEGYRNPFLKRADGSYYSFNEIRLHSDRIVFKDDYTVKQVLMEDRYESVGNLEEYIEYIDRWSLRRWGEKWLNTDELKGES